MNKQTSAFPKVAVFVFIFTTSLVAAPVCLAEDKKSAQVSKPVVKQITNDQIQRTTAPPISEIKPILPAPVPRNTTETKPVAPTQNSRTLVRPNTAPLTNMSQLPNLQVKAQLPSTDSDSLSSGWYWEITNVGNGDAAASILTITCEAIKGICPKNVAGTYQIPPLAKTTGKFSIYKHEQYARRGDLEPVNEGQNTVVEIKFTATIDSGRAVTEMNELDNVSINTWKSVKHILNVREKNLVSPKASQIYNSPFGPAPDLTVVLETGKSFAAGPVWVLVKNVGDRAAESVELEVHCRFVNSSADSWNFCPKITDNKVYNTLNKYTGQTTYNGTIYLGPIPPNSFEAAVQLTPLTSNDLGPYQVEFEVKLQRYNGEREKSYSNNTLTVTHP